eukprot:1325068-Amorphochlora_amoeboformis.AAC.1
MDVSRPTTPNPVVTLHPSHDMTSQPGHNVTSPGHVTSQPGHVTSQPGHNVTSQPGHNVTSQPGYTTSMGYFGNPGGERGRKPPL